MTMQKNPGWWTFDDEAEKDIGERLYYFAPSNRAAPPYKTQRHVTAIIDIAADGTLAGIELIDNMPPPPRATSSEPGSPVVSETSNEAVVVPNSQNPNHEWSPQAAAALDAVRKRLGADGRKR